MSDTFYCYGCGKHKPIDQRSTGGGKNKPCIACVSRVAAIPTKKPARKTDNNYKNGTLPDFMFS